MTSKIKEVFSNIKAEKRKALITYIVSGDPDTETTIEIMNSMVQQGTDIIELGIPFSDPMVDEQTPMMWRGPMVISAIKTMTQKVLWKDRDIIIVDMPPEESSDFSTEAEKVGIDIIRLIAPTTSSLRAKKICSQCSGYVYYISVKGITGASNINAEEVKAKVSELRSHTDLPIAIGFGIKDAASASSVKDVADGVVAGSVFVDLIGEGGNIIKKVESKTRELSEVLN